MPVQRDGTGLASAARAVGNYTFPIKSDEQSGILLVLDITVPNGGTVGPSILVAGDAGTNNAIVWTGSTIVNTLICVPYCVYAQGINSNFAPTQAEERGLYLPNRYTVQFAVTVATVTFSVHYYLIP